MIRFNEEDIDWKTDLTLHELLEEKGFSPKFSMVRLNDTIIAPDAFRTTTVNDGDQIQAIRFLSGG